MRTQELFVVGSQLHSNEERTPVASTDPLATFCRPAIRAICRAPGPRRVSSRSPRRIACWCSAPVSPRSTPCSSSTTKGMRRRFGSYRVRAFSARTQRLVAPFVAERLSQLLVAGRLQVFTGSVRGAAAYGDTFVVDVLPRGRKTHLSERYDWIVNCTAADFPQHARTVAPPAQQHWA